MKLRSLVIRVLPGIDGPIHIENLGDGVNIIVGPNGIGKSSLCRATRALLWRERAPEGHMVAHAVFEHPDGSWRVRREGSSYGWQHDGQEAAPPRLPPAHLDACFFLGLRDLLDLSDTAGPMVAQEIRKQLSGGFDLDRAREPFRSAANPRAGRKAGNALTLAETAVRKAASAQDALARREASLADLDGKISAAANAPARREHVRSAIELLKERQAQTADEQELAALPAALARLTGEELEQDKTRADELETKLREQALERHAQKSGATDAEQTGLQKPVDRTMLATLAEHADAIAVAAKDIEHTSVALSGKRKAIASASRHVGGREEPAAELDVVDAAQLFSWLAELRKYEEQKTAVDERLALLADADVAATDAQHLDRVRHGADALRRWLRAPDPNQADAVTEQRPSRGVLLSLAAALSVLGVLLGAAVHVGLFAVAGLGVGLGVVALWVRTVAVGARRDTHERDASRAAFPSDLAAPKDWSASIVGERLRDLESEFARLSAAEQLAGERRAKRVEHESRARDIEAKLQALEIRRQELSRQLQLPDLRGGELVELARALDQLRIAHQEEQQLKGELQKREADYAAHLRRLASELGEHGLHAPTDGASARAVVEELRARDQELRAALEKQSNAAKRLKRLDAEIEHVTAEQAKVYRSAELQPGDRAGLVRLLDALPHYRKLRMDCDQRRARIDIDESRLRKSADDALLACDRATLEAEQERLEQQSSEHEALHRTASDIRAEVRSARAGSDVENAIAVRDAAREALRESRDFVLRAAAADFLLEAVQREHETEQAPRVLERTRELFAGFTHHSYELKVSTDDRASFVAIEAGSGALRRPAELSDGTRAQLILAARLAFAEEAEHGSSLPIFLDEALDHSDPQRFRAMARTLGRIAQDARRQIVYLTNDPGDAQRIQDALAEEGVPAANVIDLANVRRRGTSVTDAQALHVESLPTVPDPAGMAAEDYGALLGVSTFDPRRGAIGQHLFYLLFDDLALLHRLLLHRVERLGQWQVLSKARAPLATAISQHGGVGGQLNARAALLDAFCEAWLEGRGKPVDREAIEASGAFSGNYIEGIAQIADELHGDAASVMQRLRDRSDDRLARLRKNATETFESFVLDKGYLDPRPRLVEADVLARVMSTAAAADLPEGFASECVHRWWHFGGG